MSRIRVYVSDQEHGGYSEEYSIWSHRPTYSLMDAVVEAADDAAFVLSGFPMDASELRRTNLLSPFIDAGGVVSWLNPSEVLVVYRNKDKADEAFEIASFLRRRTLLDYSKDNVEARAVAARIYNTAFKPVRDVSVANRFISSSLGINVSRATTAERPKPRAPSPLRQDAWDD